MRENVRKVLALSLAVLLVTGGISAATQTGMVESEDGPVGEAEAVIGTIAVATVAAVAAGTAAVAIGQWMSGGDVASQEEAIQQKIDLYQLANSQKQNTKSIETVAANNLEDSDTMLKMEGMNALQRAVSDDATLSEANTRITNRIDNRTAIKQANLLNAWTAAAENVRYIENVSDNSTHISDSFAAPTGEVVSQNIKQNLNDPQLSASVSVEIDDSAPDDWTKTVTLANGTTHNVTKIPVKVTDTSDYTDADGYDNRAQQTVTAWVGPMDYTVTTGGEIYYPSGNEHRSDYTVTAEVTPYVVTRNQSSDADAILSKDGDLPFANASKFGTLVSEVDTQNNEVTQAVTDLASSKYSAFQDGTIELEDSISPYYADHLYSTEGDDASAWMMNMMASMGVGTPAELDNVTRMNVSHDGLTYEGLLMSDGLPQGDSFVVGQTYYPSNLSGNQYMVTTGGNRYLLDGPFTVESASGPDGNLSTVTYEKPTYNVTSVSGYRQMVDYLTTKRAESEAREKNKEDGGGGGGAWFDLGGGGLLAGAGLGGVSALLMLLAVAFIALSVSNGGGGGTTVIDRRDDD